MESLSKITETSKSFSVVYKYGDNDCNTDLINPPGFNENRSRKHNWKYNLFSKQNTYVKEDDTAIKVGDIVRVKPSVKRPHYGWGCISHGSGGVVLSVE